MGEPISDAVRASDARTENRREAARVRSRLWRAENLQLARAKSNEWKKNNSDRVRAASAASYAANPGRVRLAFAGWAEKNPDAKRILVQNRRAKKRANGGALSKDLVDRLMTSQKCRCVACNGDLRLLGHHLDHIVPVRDGGENIDSNIQLLCPSCNHSKGAKNSVDFMQSRGFLL
ncbi:HNH endonuclease [Janthinobacterium sp. GB4P2]|uniref:HNH endonuclease n=1 Tax=Janthinobacterium sp. GB4P2 TaxID=3424189 RepID=UPI003F29EB4F